MVTEGVPVPCSVCYDHDPTGAPRPETSFNAPAASTVITHALSRIHLPSTSTRSFSAAVTPKEAHTHRAALRRASGIQNSPSPAAASASAVENPPDSPLPPPPLTDARSLAPFPQRRDAARFRTTYDDYSTSRLQKPCESCALTLPSQAETRTNTLAFTPTPSAGDSRSSVSATAGTSSAPTSPTPTSSRRYSSITMPECSSDSRGPTLRTRAPYARVYGTGDPGEADMATPPESQDSSSDREGIDYQPHRSSRPSTISSSRTNSPSSHMHFFDYTSTHQPTHPENFSLIRHSCLRTLSQETLPRSTTTSSDNSANKPASPTSQNMFPGIINQSPFVTTHTSGTAVAGGPIAFGDPADGFTTAYVFRVTDVQARGNKRLYAFLAFSTQREYQAMRTFSYLASEFRELATWVQSLAEAEAQRVEESRGLAPWMVGLDANVPPSRQQQVGASAGADAASAGLTTATTGRGGGILSGERPRGPEGSSFLSGGSRRYGGALGGGGGGMNPRARGLAELLGKPNFFIELHAKFVHLLLELGVLLSS